MSTKKSFYIGVVGIAVLFFQAVTVLYANEIVVQGFTDEAIQVAVDAADNGDTVFLPAGDYYFDYTVIVEKRVTFVGAAQLMNVGVVERGEADDPPYWDSPHSHCFTDVPNRTLFKICSDDVTLKNLQLSGAVTHTEGYGSGIMITEFNRLGVENCVLTHFLKGVSLVNSFENHVRGCYITENFRDGYGYGICIVGDSMTTGGSQVDVRDNEFSKNRHAIASNSPRTSFVIENNYFHDNDLSQKQACVDIHPQGGYTLRAVVRNNIFERTMPMAFQSGSIEITGNYFDQGCGDYSVGGASRMINFGIPAHNDQEVPEASLHDIYISDNYNYSFPYQRLLWVTDYNFEGVRKFVAYNLFVNGYMFKHNSDLTSPPEYPYPGSSPNPFVGQMYVTLPGSDERVTTIESDTWYDLHVFAVDPEGADTIAEIGAQLINTDLTPRDISEGIDHLWFSADGNYFIRGDGVSVYSRETESSADWTDRSGGEGLYTDGTQSSWETSGDQRIHFTARFRLPDRAVGGQWRLYGYARDNDGNLPIAAWHELSEGWRLEVDSPGMTSVDDAVPQEYVVFDSVYPNPFNPETTIGYTLNAPGRVKLRLYDVLGREIETLVDDMKAPGSYSMRWNAEGLASGVYFCRIDYNASYHCTRKILLMK